MTRDDRDARARRPLRLAFRGARPRRRTHAALPAVLLVPAALAVALVVLPLAAIAVQAPWARLGAVLADSAALAALAMSLGTAAAATALSLVLGVPLALVLAGPPATIVARPPGRSRRILRAFITVPVVLPPVAGGVALLALLGPEGVVGGPLAAIGLGLVPSAAAVVIAQTFVAMPFLVFAVEGAIRGGDGRAELAAATLGASRLTIVRRVTLPLAGSGIAAGAALCFARALGEYGATITFAGSVPGVTRTLPMAIYEQLPTDRGAAIALALLLIALSVVVLVALRGRWAPGLRS